MVEYVLCKECKSLETVLEKEDKTSEMNCSKFWENMNDVADRCGMSL